MQFVKLCCLQYMSFHESLGRVGGLASVDLLGTAAVAYWLGNDTTSRLKWFGALFVIGEIAHFAFNQETPVTKKIKSRD